MELVAPGGSKLKCSWQLSIGKKGGCFFFQKAGVNETVYPLWTGFLKGLVGSADGFGGGYGRFLLCWPFNMDSSKAGRSASHKKQPTKLCGLFQILT